MKIVQLVNQNIPIWSVLKGDHACTDLSLYLNDKLISSPDFLNPKENLLRSDYLKATKGRRWLYDYLYEKSFALIELEETDIKEAFTVWKNTSVLDIANQYKTAQENNTGFEFKEVKKTRQMVLEVSQRKKTLPLVETNNLSWMTEFNQDFDYQRTIWMKTREGKLTIVDGTHRVVATTWKYYLDKGKMPNKKWCAFFFNE